MIEPTKVDPLLRWAGGKRQFAHEFGESIHADVVNRGGRYYEPFVGSAAMALYIGVEKMTLGDVDPDLVDMYRGIRDNSSEIIKILKALELFGTSKESYFMVRKTDPSTISERAARLIYLNRLCFNGIYRKNKSGGFNVPYGGKEKNMPDEVKIRKIARVLQGVIFHTGDFEGMIKDTKKGDTIYADPPYHGVGFDNYSGQGFGDGDQERLATALWDATQRGTSILAHNADTEEVRYWYSEWAEIHVVKEKRTVSASGNRDKASCVLIIA